MDRVSPHYYYTSVLGLKVPLLCQFYIEWLFSRYRPLFQANLPGSGPISWGPAQSIRLGLNIPGSGPISRGPAQSIRLRPNLSGSGLMSWGPAQSIRLRSNLSGSGPFSRGFPGHQLRPSSSAICPKNSRRRR